MSHGPGTALDEDLGPCFEEVEEKKGETLGGRPGATSDAMRGEPLLTRFTALYTCAANSRHENGATSRGVARSLSLAAWSLLLFQDRCGSNGSTGLDDICSTDVKCGEPRQ